MLIFEGVHHAAVGLAHLIGGLEIQADPARVGFVHDVRRNDFHDNGEADFFAKGQRFVFGASHQVSRGRNARAFKNFLALVLHEITAVVPHRLMDDFRQFLAEQFAARVGRRRLLPL